MAATESIKELRRICQAGRENEFYRMPWIEKNVFRKISIYLTKLFLIIGTSANQVSFIGFVITVLAGIFLLFPEPKYWFIGIALLMVCEVIGVADGEVARYKKAASLKGAFWNSMPEQFTWLYTPICISFGLYNIFQNIYPLIFGFLAIISISLTTYALFLPYPILREKGLLSEALSPKKPAGSEEQVTKIIKYGQFLNHFAILLFAFLISTLVDYFISPFSVGSLSFNVRYVCFISYTLLWLASAIRNVYLPLHSGVRLRL